MYIMDRNKKYKKDKFGNSQEVKLPSNVHNFRPVSKDSKKFPTKKDIPNPDISPDGTCRNDFDLTEPDCLIISEVHWYKGDDDDWNGWSEPNFIEIYNRCPYFVQIGNWEIRSQSSSGTEYTRARFNVNWDSNEWFCGARFGGHPDPNDWTVMDKHYHTNWNDTDWGINPYDYLVVYHRHASIEIQHDMRNPRTWNSYDMLWRTQYENDFISHNLDGNIDPQFLWDLNPLVEGLDGEGVLSNSFEPFACNNLFPLSTEYSSWNISNYGEYIRLYNECGELQDEVLICNGTSIEECSHLVWNNENRAAGDEETGTAEMNMPYSSGGYSNWQGPFTNYQNFQLLAPHNPDNTEGNTGWEFPRITQKLNHAGTEGSDWSDGGRRMAYDSHNTLNLNGTPGTGIQKDKLISLEYKLVDWESTSFVSFPVNMELEMYNWTYTDIITPNGASYRTYSPLIGEMFAPLCEEGVLQSIISANMAANCINGQWIGSLSMEEHKATNGYLFLWNQTDNVSGYKVSVTGKYGGPDLEYELDAGSNFISYSGLKPLNIYDALTPWMKPNTGPFSNSINTNPYEGFSTDTRVTGVIGASEAALIICSNGPYIFDPFTGETGLKRHTLPDGTWDYLSYCNAFGSLQWLVPGTSYWVVTNDDIPNFRWNIQPKPNNTWNCHIGRNHDQLSQNTYESDPYFDYSPFIIGNELATTNNITSMEDMCNRWAYRGKGCVWDYNEDLAELYDMVENPDGIQWDANNPNVNWPYKPFSCRCLHPENGCRDNDWVNKPLHLESSMTYSDSESGYIQEGISGYVEISPYHFAIPSNWWETITPERMLSKLKYTYNQWMKNDHWGVCKCSQGAAYCNNPDEGDVFKCSNYTSKESCGNSYAYSRGCYWESRKPIKPNLPTQ